MFLIDKNFWEVRKTNQKGRGVFVKKKIKSGKVIGDYLGELLPLEKIDFEKEKENMYLMYFNDDLGIYPDMKAPGVYLLNHSCSPNCFIKRYKKHTIVFTLRNINKGEELSISYLLPPKENCSDCKHQCYCESSNCTGTMHLSETLYKKWQKFQKLEDEDKTPKVNGKILGPLKSYPKRISKKYIISINKLFRLSQP